MIDLSTYYIGAHKREEINFTGMEYGSGMPERTLEKEEVVGGYEHGITQLLAKISMT